MKHSPAPPFEPVWPVRPALGHPGPSFSPCLSWLQALRRELSPPCSFPSRAACSTHPSYARIPPPSPASDSTVIFCTVVFSTLWFYCVSSIRCGVAAALRLLLSGCDCMPPCICCSLLAARWRASWRPSCADAVLTRTNRPQPTATTLTVFHVRTAAFSALTFRNFFLVALACLVITV